MIGGCVKGEQDAQPVRLTVGEAKVRIARKAHTCAGPYDHAARKRIRCNVGDGRIAAGDLYVEYFGEAAAYQSGQRYHVACAVTQGIAEIAPAPEPER